MTASSIRATLARFCLFALRSPQKPTRVSCIQTHLELPDCKIRYLCLGAFRQSFRLRMTEKQPNQIDPKREKPDIAEKKKRLAAALRRNLAKRKSIKEAKNVDNA